MDRNFLCEKIANIRFRVSSFSDKLFLNAWMSNTKTNLKETFPGISLEENFLFGYGINRWCSSFDICTSITMLVNDFPVAIGSFWVYDSLSMKHHAMFGMIVDPENRGKGFGRKMMHKLVEFARDVLDLEFLELGVLSSNARAIKLYKSFQFVNQYVQKNVVKIDGRYQDIIVMRKALNTNEINVL